MSKDGILGLKDVFSKRNFRDMAERSRAFLPGCNVVSVSICFLEGNDEKCLYKLFHPFPK